MKCPHCRGSGELENVGAGDLITAQRKAKGMTQQDLALQVQLSRAQVANIENGRSDMPVSALARFAKALGCEAKDLVP
jgi:transcriptional regulator with XRE-family HTH domain